MKKFSILCFSLLALALTSQAAIISTNLPITGVYLLSTNRAAVYSVELTSTTNSLINLYDCDSLAVPFYGTNYTNASYVGRVSYATNYVTSFVGYNGYTNWYTNAGLWTINVTNAANTNALPSQFSAVVAPGTYAVYTTDALFSRGIAVSVVGTNTSIVVNYRSAGQ